MSEEFRWRLLQVDDVLSGDRIDIDGGVHLIRAVLRDAGGSANERIRLRLSPESVQAAHGVPDELWKRWRELCGEDPGRWLLLTTEMADPVNGVCTFAGIFPAEQLVNVTRREEWRQGGAGPDLLPV